MANGCTNAFKCTIGYRAHWQPNARRNFNGKLRLNRIKVLMACLTKAQFLAEVNLEDLENTCGERQEYWLVAMRAAREARLLCGDTQLNTGCRTIA
jgi:hypothetical protein